MKIILNIGNYPDNSTFDFTDKTTEREIFETLYEYLDSNLEQDVITISSNRVIMQLFLEAYKHKESLDIVYHDHNGNTYQLPFENGEFLIPDGLKGTELENLRYGTTAQLMFYKTGAITEDELKTQITRQ